MPEIRESMIHATETVFVEIQQRYGELPPNQAKDGLYFDSRLQCLLHGSSYWRQLLFDERNKLLDETILDFMEKIPDRLRLQKRLYGKTVEKLTRLFPPLRVASTDNLEDWNLELMPDRPIGRYYMEEICDLNSGILEYIDQRVVRVLLEGGVILNRSFSQNVKSHLKNKTEQIAFQTVPRAARRLQTSLRRKRIRRDQILKRVIVLKHWHDRFVTKRKDVLI